MRTFLFTFFTISVIMSYAQQKMTSELLWEIGRVHVDLTNSTGKVVYSVSQYDTQDNSQSKQLFIYDLATDKTTAITASNQRTNAIQLDTKALLYTQNKALYRYNLMNETTEKQLDQTPASLSINDEGAVIFTRLVKVNAVLAQDFYPELKEASVRRYDDLMYRHWDSWDDGEYTHVFVAPSLEEMDKAIDVTADEPYDVLSCQWSPDGRIVYVSKKLTGKVAAQSTDTNIYFYDLTTKKTTAVTSDNLGYDRNPSFSPDGTKMAYLQMKTPGYESDKEELIVLDLKTNKKTNLTADWDNTVSRFIWGKDHSSLYFLAGVQATYQLFEIHAKNKKIRQITTGDHNYTDLHLVQNQLIGGRQDLNHATEIFKVNISNGEETPISSVNHDLYKRLALSTIEKRWIKTNDGKDMLTWVVYPPNFDPNKKYPALLYCQGGPQSAVSQFYSFRWNLQLMAAQGYIVIAPNRRGLPSFGTQWNKQISKDWGGKAIDDYLAATDALAKEPYVDNTRIGAVGASYGGYSVYQLAGVHNKRFKTFIAHCGLFDMTSWYGVTEELFFGNYDLGGAYFEANAQQSYTQFNPIVHVDKWDTPLMVIHGGKDFRVPENQGMEAFTAAKLKGLKSRFLYFPEENHWILNPQNALVWQREFFKWLDETL